MGQIWSFSPKNDSVLTYLAFKKPKIDIQIEKSPQNLNLLPNFKSIFLFSKISKIFGLCFLMYAILSKVHVDTKYMAIGTYKSKLE